MSAIEILRQEKGWIAINKAAGVLVIPGRGAADVPSLREQLEAECGQKVFVVHRLDRDTSGVLLFALDAATHRTLSMAFEASRIRKCYRALVAGVLREPVDVRLALAPARRGRMRPSGPGEAGKDARTLVRPVEVFAKATLIEAEPLTGRTHQIRVHLSSIGHPLLVDHQYGHALPVTESEGGWTGGAPVLSRTPLHAARLELPELEGIAASTLEAPFPGDMAAALALLRARG